MFLHVTQGRVPDRTAMRAQHDVWVREIGAEASGWLDVTAGVTEDDRFICLSRFASVEALARLAARRDHREWWARTARLFLGPVITSEFTDIAVMADAETDEAGFVQIVQGRATDVARQRALVKELLRHLPDGRPDMLGGLAATGPDGRFVWAFAFSSEELARAGEHGEQLPEIVEILDDLRAVSGEPTYHDLRHPWLATAPGKIAAAAGRQDTAPAGDRGREPEKAGSRAWSPSVGRTTARR
jgi:hypothetical protein